MRVIWVASEPTVPERARDILASMGSLLEFINDHLIGLPVERRTRTEEMRLNLVYRP